LVTAGGNYAVTFHKGVLTIDQRSVTVTAGAQSRAYGNANPAFTEQITSGSMVNADTLTGSMTTAAIFNSNVGSYAITQGSVTAGGNYALTVINGRLTITPRALTISADNATKVQGNPNPTLIASATGFANGESWGNLTGVLFLATTATAASPFGGYAITASGYVSTNYAISYVNGMLTVTPKIVDPFAGHEAEAAGALASAMPWQAFDSTAFASPLSWETSDPTTDVSATEWLAFDSSEGGFARPWEVLDPRADVASAAVVNGSHTRCATGGAQARAFRIIDSGMRLPGGLASDVGQDGCSARQ
jgi:hypothetical protein